MYIRYNENRIVAKRKRKGPPCPVLTGQFEGKAFCIAFAKTRAESDNRLDCLQSQKDRAPELQGIVKNILIVDDSDSARVAIRAAIENCTSFRVCGEAADGVEAIEKGPELNPDLVIMDLAMPQMNGFVAASLLKKKIPEIPIVLFTIYADELRDSLSTALGVTMVLSKDSGLVPLVDCLDALLGPA